MKYVIPLLLLSTITAAADQQPACGDITAAYTYLLKQYGEHPMIQMKDASNRTLVIFTNPTTRTWTVLQFLNDTKSCAIASGEDLTPADFKAMDEKYLDKGPPT